MFGGCAHRSRAPSNIEVAATRYLAEATMTSYLERILQRLELRDRIQAVICGTLHA